MNKKILNLNCPSCGGQLSVNKTKSIVKCPYCGNEYFIDEILGEVPACPVCGRNDRVIKISSITKEHFMYDILGFDLESFPLPKVDYESYEGSKKMAIWVWLLAVLPVLFLQIILKRGGKDFTGCTFPVVFILIIGIGITIYAKYKMNQINERNAQKENIHRALTELNHKEYQRLKPIHEKLNYCHRDNVVFLPYVGDFADAKDMRDYLRKHV